MLLSGYHSFPHKRMYWQTQPDVHVSIVAEAMRSNHFDEIVRYLHIANNAAWMVHQLFDHLNTAFKQTSVGDSVSINESMIPYFGHHSAKQFIKFGFKLWVAADPSGYIFHVEPYCGTSTRFLTTGNGQGNYVIGPVDHLQLKKGTRLYLDNFFTSVSLLRNPKSNNIGATGTLRENRCVAVMKLQDKKAFRKNKLCDMVVSSCDDLAVRWKDNSVVTVLTNCDEVEPKKKSFCYYRTEEKTVIVEVPGQLPSIMPTWVVWTFVINFFHILMWYQIEKVTVVFRAGCYIAD
ncbi:hypothetical protein PR048_031996 [Dryococelus australis]|uniref:PiggyBac transposable element-derived protein domain-containing protein n=1 Tax=Dryococelus australis TaxID=614101 RepID=A0ABQ9G7U3_9NEOP|nr:hypothetical protein PR048_031996 [Dryococelus australis]